MPESSESEVKAEETETRDIPPSSDITFPREAVSPVMPLCLFPTFSDPDDVSRAATILIVS